MKTMRISVAVRVAMLGLLAICLGAGSANAQEYKGAFTLPFEAHWGATKLSPGNYSFTVDSAAGPRVVTLFRGRNAVVMILSQVQGDEKSGRSELIVVRNDAGFSVRELDMPQIGMALRYRPYKLRRNKASEEGEIAQVIPVSLAAK
jgi:hypothetical protein